MKQKQKLIEIPPYLCIDTLPEIVPRWPPYFDRKAENLLHTIGHK
jgi:hypothetical protein